MYEDKLTNQQRVRLEALAQANATLSTPFVKGISGSDTVGKIIGLAARYEEFLVYGKENDFKEDQ